VTPIQSHLNAEINKVPFTFSCALYSARMKNILVRFTQSHVFMTMVALFSVPRLPTEYGRNRTCRDRELVACYLLIAMAQTCVAT